MHVEVFATSVWCITAVMEEPDSLNYTFLETDDLTILTITMDHWYHHFMDDNELKPYIGEGAHLEKAVPMSVHINADDTTSRPASTEGVIMFKNAYVPYPKTPAAPIENMKDVTELPTDPTAKTQANNCLLYTSDAADE